MFMRIHRSGNEVIVALCDAELMGKVLREGEVVIDLKKYGKFYKAGRVKAGKQGEREVAKALGEASSINAVGERAVAAVRRVLGVSEEKVRNVAGVPHMQAYKV